MVVFCLFHNKGQRILALVNLVLQVSGLYEIVHWRTEMVVRKKRKARPRSRFSHQHTETVLICRSLGNENGALVFVIDYTGVVREYTAVENTVNIFLNCKADRRQAVECGF